MHPHIRHVFLPICLRQLMLSMWTASTQRICRTVYFTLWTSGHLVCFTRTACSAAKSRRRYWRRVVVSTAYHYKDSWVVETYIVPYSTDADTMLVEPQGMISNAGDDLDGKMAIWIVYTIDGTGIMNGWIWQWNKAYGLQKNDGEKMNRMKWDKTLKITLHVRPAA